MKESWIDQHHVVHVMKAAVQADNGDMFNGNLATPCIALREWRRVTWIIATGTGAVGTGKIQVESCATAAGGTNTAIAFKYRACTASDTWGAWTAAVAATGFTTAAAADKIYEVTAEAGDLVSGQEFVRLIATEVADGAVHGSIIAILTDGKYPQAIPQSVLA